jgi:hypothetical protein
MRTLMRPVVSMLARRIDMMKFRCSVRNVQDMWDVKYFEFEARDWRDAPMVAIQFADHEYVLSAIEVLK